MSADLHLMVWRRSLADDALFTDELPWRAEVTTQGSAEEARREGVYAVSTNDLLASETFPTHAEAVRVGLLMLHDLA